MEARAGSGVGGAGIVTLEFCFGSRGKGCGQCYLRAGEEGGQKANIAQLPHTSGAAQSHAHFYRWQDKAIALGHP